MRSPQAITGGKQLLRILASFIIITMIATTAGADEPATNQATPVFQPNETQHGFAEYDTPPDYSSDKNPIPYDGYSQSPPSLDQKPGGVFQNLEFAESVEDDRTFRRGHFYTPVNPTNTFSSNVPSVYLVFAVHKHLSSYQIIGRLFLENGTGMDSTQWLDEDIVELATEDESGFLKFFSLNGSWQPGRYRVDVYVGYVASPMNKMGAMRFTINPSPKVPPSP